MRDTDHDGTIQKEHRPWGYYEVLSAEHHDHKVKRITVLPGKRLSLQYHAGRREHWIVISGKAVATVDGRHVELGPSGSIDIPQGSAHRIENVGVQDLVFIEVQQGEYFGEDDIVRLEDDFGRV
ncbi:MAG: cupin domain-containing protein [Deltaproteobacteria bacterium]|nr:cupin domain-containing protein [Deltaproteobacteria bacterium]